MKARRSICLVITFLHVLQCTCQDSEERVQVNRVSYSEMDRFEPSLGSLNGLLVPLERSGSSNIDRTGVDNAVDTGTQRVKINYNNYKSAKNVDDRLRYERLNNYIKRGWGKMNAAWGKRDNNGVRNAGWSKFSGAWGKREPGWNNLKGLWGKRTEKLNQPPSVGRKGQDVTTIY